MKKLIAASITAAAAVALLAGCSNPTPEDATTATATPEPTKSAAAASNTCEDGVLTVTDSKAAKQALKQGCDTVYLLTSGVDLQLGAVKSLGIEGSDNTVEVESLDSISILGTKNTVQHGGVAPKADNVQDGNTITAK